MLIIRKLKSYLKRRALEKQWKRQNQCNFTSFGNDFRFNKVTVGQYTYGTLNVTDTGDENSAGLRIGSFCSIAKGVEFLLSGEHALNTVSTFPFKAVFSGNVPFSVREAHDKGNIIVDDDVWIGAGAIICSGVHIGQGAVIAAGAVVTRDVEPYAVVGGVPAAVIRKRFSDKMIASLLHVDYSRLTAEQIKAHMNDLYSPLCSVEQLAWLPKK